MDGQASLLTGACLGVWCRLDVKCLVDISLEITSNSIKYLFATGSRWDVSLADNVFTCSALQQALWLQPIPMFPLKKKKLKIYWCVYKLARDENISQRCWIIRTSLPTLSLARHYVCLKHPLLAFISKIRFSNTDFKYTRILARISTSNNLHILSIFAKCTF